MSDVISLARRVDSLNASPQFDNYSKVIIHVSDETTYEVGNDTGRTLEIDNPFGTAQMAQDILDSLIGYQYQPYDADGALLDPAAEVGDAVNARGIYGGIYTRTRNFGTLMKASISAPQDEEINHEYQYVAPQDRQYKRAINEVKASLIIKADEILAEVVKQTDGDSSSFGWSLTSSGHRWYADGNEVMAITATGLKVTGEVEATTGKIGNFNISATAIWNNISEFDTPGSPTSGVYVGTDGIQLGQKFKVDQNGNCTATRLAVDTLVIGGTNVSASTLNSRANNAYASTTSGGYCYKGATYGNNYNDATNKNSGNYPNFFRTKQLSVNGYGFVRGTSFVYNGITHYPWEWQA